METLEEALAALAEKDNEITKLKSVKAEIVGQRDELKKKYSEAETKLTGYEETITKTASELEAERNKRNEVATIHTMMLKTSALRAQLEKEGVVAVDTALKLVALDEIGVDDAFSINSDSVVAVVTKLKETDKVLFGTTTTAAIDAADIPKPKRASEGEPKAGFAEELKNCKKASEVEALLRKHGKIS